MNSTELIRALSKNGAEDLSSSLQWIKPIPEDVTALIEKINMALKIVKFSQSRCAEETRVMTSNDHLDSLKRLKSEIESILNKTKVL